MGPFAVTSQSWYNGVYLIKDDTIIGKMKIVNGATSSHGSHIYVSVKPDDDATRAFFEDDYTIPILGDVVGLRYDGVEGKPYPGIGDEPENRHKNTRIVDVIDFDYGHTHPYFESVKGYGRGLLPPSK